MDFIAYDLETTGIDPERDRIVEIAAVRFLGGRPEKAWSTLVNPGIPIPEGALKVHGITDMMVRSQPTIDQVLKPFADFCGNLTLVAHNARFDFAFLKRFIQEHKSAAPGGMTLDTFALAKRVHSGLSNHRLSTIVEHLKLPPGGFHRAEQDAAYCGQIFQNILEILGRAGEPLDPKSLAQFSGRSELFFPKIKSDAAQGQLGLF